MKFNVKIIPGIFEESMVLTDFVSVLCQNFPHQMCNPNHLSPGNMQTDTMQGLTAIKQRY